MSNPAGEGLCGCDEQLLLDALCREPGAWAKVIANLDRYLSSIARHRLPDLSADIQEEFKQEVWVRVASRPPEDFSRRAQTAKAFVRRFVPPAINKVRADYCPPGKRTRDRSPSDHLVPIADMRLLEDQRAVAAFDAASARIDLERALAVAEPPLQRGLLLMKDEDLTLAAAARQIRMPRETFRRRMLRLPEMGMERQLLRRQRG